MNDINPFVAKTIEALGVEKDNKRLSAGFALDDNRDEDCVLIMGINPAGDENDAENAKKEAEKPYLFSLKNSGYPNLTYNAYFGRIYKFVNEALTEGGKWSWCNKSRDQIEKLFSNDPIILEEYDKNKKKRYTIHVGDIFYYHETNSKKIIEKINNKDIHSIAFNILKDHIEYLENHKRRIKFVYINNATVSNWLTNGTYKTFELVEGVPVFYGGMLSGQRPIDNYSKERLIKEIKAYLEKR